MTKTELKEATKVATELEFNFVNRKRAGIDFKWTKKELKQDIKDALEEVAEDFGHVEARPVISIKPETNELVISLWSTDDLARDDFQRAISWDEFEETMLDCDMDAAMWLESHLKNLLKKLRKDIEEAKQYA